MEGRRDQRMGARSHSNSSFMVSVMKCQRTHGRRGAGPEPLRSRLSPEQCRHGETLPHLQGDVFNIQGLEDRGVQVRAWCVTADGVPIGDINLAQKIALEACESEVLKIANRSSGTVWPPPQPYSRTPRS
jgi:hypothetical protein